MRRYENDYLFHFAEMSRVWRMVGTTHLISAKDENGKIEDPPLSLSSYFPQFGLLHFRISASSLPSPNFLFAIPRRP